MSTADIEPAGGLPINLPALEGAGFEPGYVEQDGYAEQLGKIRRFGSVALAAAEGAVFGPFRELKDIWGEVKQAVSDHRSIKKLIHEQTAGDGTVSENPDKRTPFQDRLGFAALKAWYLLPLPAYQVADDIVTYPLFIAAQEHFNTGTAYGMAGGATLGLAAAMGYGQRIAEKKKADLVQADVQEEDSEIIPSLLDASVNSAPWQVVRKANEPRGEDEPIRLVSGRRVWAYSGAYAVVNTGLYTAANTLPVNSWAGFGVMLAGMWSAKNAYNSGRERAAELQELKLPEETIA